MELLRELTDEQKREGYLSDEALNRIAESHSVPLYQVEGLASFYTHFRRSPATAPVVQVCRDAVCRLANSQQLLRALEKETAEIEIEEVSCLGQCDHAPATCGDEATRESVSSALNVIHPDRTIEGTVRSAAPNADRFLCDPYSDAEEQYSTIKQQIAQQQIAGGTDYSERCLRQLESSGLRGMGGAGFPTARKWRTVAEQSSTTRYVICNADESEPGTFKDRVLLERAPHLVIEGMIAAGLTVGAERGIIYLRHEYESALESITAELKRARNSGALGTDAASSGHAFEIEVFVSPGGYILGEETALLEALEGRRGEPRNKPPFPAVEGLYGKPTLINNVETFALVTSILHHGSDWWCDQGVGECRGLKFVSVSGDVKFPGVFEVPMGTPIRDIVELAGGVPGGRHIAAFLPGGASSRFLPPECLDLPLDFDAVRQAGSLLGTAAIVVFADHRDLFDAASSLVRFFRNESCGKCVPCRLGTAQTVTVLEDIQSGKRSSQSLAPIHVLEQTLQQTSICGLGHVALNPLTSLMEHFPESVGPALDRETEI